MAGAGEGSSTVEDKSQHIWALLPSFDPSTDNVREYIEKVKFLDGICPSRDRAMLAPRLAMLCKGTAWGQVKGIPASQLTDAENGVKNLLTALSTWEESSEMRTFELFEKAIYKTTQRHDESTMSYVNRMQVAFNELGTTSLEEVRAFLLLRQSSLTTEDKKKVLTMTQGKMEKGIIEQSMRTLATSILSSAGEPKKKVYPTNYVEPEVPEAAVTDTAASSAFNISSVEDEEIDDETVEYYANGGDADALQVQSFERDLEDLFQEIPDMHRALITYQAARQKLVEKRKYRGFWPSGKGKNFSGYKGGKKGGGGKRGLLDRIARSHCKICGEKGHWKDECPNKPKDTANVVTHMDPPGLTQPAMEQAHVIFDENIEEAFTVVPEVETMEQFAENIDRVKSLPNKDKVSKLLKKYCTQNDVFTENNRSYQGLDKLKGMDRIDKKGFQRGDSVVAADPRGRFKKPLSNNDSQNRFRAFSDRAIAFMSHRLQNRFGKVVDGNSTATMDCLTSKPSMETVNWDGLAILDTGASRSVIGEDIVPALLKNLPWPTRSLIKIVPSRVGFKFGNNQVTHSFQQLRIPIMQRNKKIWLIVEVVPKATPFLLSIQTMKVLGAHINLEDNQCFLKRLDRSLTLRQSKNGLYMIHMGELCFPNENNEPTLLANHQSSSSADSDGVHPDSCDSDAKSTRSGFDASDHSTECGREPPIPAVDLDESVRSEEPRTGSICRPCSGNHALGGRSAKSERKDRRAFTFAAKSWRPIKHDGDISDTTPHSSSSAVFGRRIRDCGAHRNASDDSTSSTFTTKASNSNKDQSTSRTWTESSCRSTSGEPSNDCGARHSECATYGESIGFDCTGSRVMGKQESVLGQKAYVHEVFRGVRERPRLLGLAPSKSFYCKSSHARFSDLLPGKRAVGTPSVCTTRHLNFQDRLTSMILQVETHEELQWLLACRRYNDTSCQKSIDLLEVYAQPDSRLSSEVHRQGGSSRRFTFEDGNLSTFDGQVQLLRTIYKYSPRNIWLAPECAPWCAWNRFNMSRGQKSHLHVLRSQEESRTHLRLCALIVKIQLEQGRHVHIENPATSSIWDQPEFEPILRCTIAAFIDQCQFGLQHPETGEPLKKKTRIQTSSRELHQELDGRVCNHQHQHAQIAGSCRFQGKTIALSRFAAWYPRTLAKVVAKIIRASMEPSNIIPVYAITDRETPERPESREAKRSKTEGKDNPKKHSRSEIEGEEEQERINKREKKQEVSEGSNEVDNHQEWKKIFQELQTQLPKSGSVVWNGAEQDLIKKVQALLADIDVQSIVAAKGRDRYMTHLDALSARRTIAQRRVTNEIVDLGTDQLDGMSRNQQGRKAIPSHIMLCAFGRLKDKENVDPQSPLDPELEAFRKKFPSEASSSKPPVKEGIEDTDALPLSSWTAAAVSQSGPRFRSLSSEQQAMIRQLHNNLGHPTSEKLARHFEQQGMEESIVNGAKDFLCSSCVERRPPSLHVPGRIKEAHDFNQRLYMDGFEWRNKTGSIKTYVLHIIDEATQFHLGRRTQRDSQLAQRVFEDCWSSWAGTPFQIVLDCGGEFVSEPWKEYLKQENIQCELTAAPWQRGRIERHGGIVKEMLSRIDNENPITTDAQFDRALHQCFRAKNMLASINGYSPEQAVLGKSTRLPASIISDEEVPAHLHASDPEAERFFNSLRLRTEARRAFLESDNSQAARRALLRKSRGEGMDWKNGQPCMYWDKRKSPNMLEKGKWCGPAQVVLAESRSIIWITHMNRLLRCARDNLRPVSLREFSRHRPFVQHIEDSKLQEMSKQLEKNLQQRSGMFQFSDLSDLVAESAETSTGMQPEEEPYQQSRRNSISEVIPNEPPRLEAHEIPIPEDSMSEVAPTTPDHNEDPPTRGVDGDDAVTPTSIGENQNPEGEIQGGEEEQSHHETVHVCIVENADAGDIIQGDEDTLWTEAVDTQYGLQLRIRDTMPTGTADQR